MDKVNGNLFFKFSIPLVIVDFYGKIVWNNENFEKMFEDKKIFNLYLEKIMVDFNLEKVLRNIENNVLDEKYTIFLNEKCYQMFYETLEMHRRKEIKSNIVLYFIDKTKEYQLIENDLKKNIVQCIVMIDNFEEVLQNTPSESHGKLLGTVEQTIISWANEFYGVIKKCEKDKFFVLFENENFERIIKDKFEILNKVRNIDEGNKISITLSVGVGKSECGIFENNKLSQSALDMALGRGGDQAIIKDEKSFCFYGAKTREIEKRTKVKIRVFTHAFKEILEGFDKVVIMGHKNVDLDCLGAAVGLFRICFMKNKDTYILIENKTGSLQKTIENIENFPEYKDKIVNEQEILKIFDEGTLLIIIDTGRVSLVESPQILNMSKQTILIDHHRRSEDFIENTILSYHEPFASSTSEIVTEMFEYIITKNNVRVEEAEIVYSGIIMDTKNFTFKTGKRTFEAAAYLKSIGINTSKVKKMFQSEISLFLKKIEILKSLEIYNGNIAIVYGEYNTSQAQILSSMIADDLLEIENVKASFVLISSNNVVIISSRSFDELNVQIILEKFGGGGHMTIAGAQIPCESLECVIEKLKYAIDESLRED
ncbi:MAG: DHH family phosphoesterase [Clostridiales bacterium]|nr:DHH family phosphoesterase [Clostridiales bacterium]